MIKNLFKKFYFSENKISNKLRAFNYHKKLKANKNNFIIKLNKEIENFIQEEIVSVYIHNLNRYKCYLNDSYCVAHILRFSDSWTFINYFKKHPFCSSYNFIKKSDYWNFKSLYYHLREFENLNYTFSKSVLASIDLTKINGEVFTINFLEENFNFLSIKEKNMIIIWEDGTKEMFQKIKKNYIEEKAQIIFKWGNYSCNYFIEKLNKFERKMKKLEKI